MGLDLLSLNAYRVESALVHTCTVIEIDQILFLFQKKSIIGRKGIRDYISNLTYYVYVKMYSFYIFIGCSFKDVNLYGKCYPGLRYVIHVSIYRSIISSLLGK